jgi:hypothetical protein
MSVEAVPAKLESMLELIDTARIGLEAILKAPGVQIDRSLLDSVSKLASAHANLSREAMRWSEKLKKQASSSSLAERKTAVVGFVMSLPTGERKPLYRELARQEAALPDGLKLEV